MFRVSIVLIALMITGCTEKENLPEGVVHRTETSARGDGPEVRREIYLKNSLPYQEFGYYKDGKRFYEEYTTKVDTVWFINHIEFYPSGEIKEFKAWPAFAITLPDEPGSGYKYYLNGNMKARRDTHIEEEWYETGEKELEYVGNNSGIQKITKWYHNGQRKEETELMKNQRNGKWFEWDSLGHQTRNEFYVNGKLKK